MIGAGTAARVRGNTDQPAGARFTGKHATNGRPIYAETARDYATRPAKDAAGAVLYHLNADGTRRAPKMEQYVKREYDREFIMDDLGNGVVVKNYAFQPAADEVARIEAAAEAAPEAVLNRLATLEAALAKMGIGEQHLKALAEGPERKPAADAKGG
jgi:hypothetical protein